MKTTNENPETIQKSGKGMSVFTGLLIGGLIGAGTALLFAPQPGAKTRAELQQGAEQFRERTTETVKGKAAEVKTRANQIKADVIIKAENLQHQGKDLLARQLGRISQAAEAGKQAVES